MIVFVAMSHGHAGFHGDRHGCTCGKYGLQSEVILLRYRIEFVIVTASAGKRQPKESGACGINGVRESLVSQLRCVQVRLLDFLSERVKTRSYPRLQVLQFFQWDVIKA